MQSGLRQALALTGLWLVAGLAHGEIYRCQGADGVVYQDLPCEGPGERLQMPVDSPDPAEVERQRQRQAEMRALIEAAEARRQAEQAQSAPAPAVPSAPPPGAVRERADRDDDRDSDRDACPLGLAGCKKPGDRVFRRPADPQRPTNPLGINSSTQTPSAETADETDGGTLADPGG